MNPPAEMVAAGPAGGHHVGFSRVAEAIRIAGGMPRMVLNFARRIALLVLPWLALGVSQAEDTFLPPKEAYKYTVEATQGDVVVRIDIQPGYYLYRDRLGLESATPGVTVGVPGFPRRRRPRGPVLRQAGHLSRPDRSWPRSSGSTGRRDPST